jgi:oxygen-independent coproporphyrinogen III oxidase
VRELTGLGRSHKEWDDIRLACYRTGRDFLLHNGYRQFSMRRFYKSGSASNDFNCQEDGMVGLGCGARSYAGKVHFSRDYAVGPKDIKRIIADYLACGEDGYRFANRGMELDDEERRRRFVLQSILNVNGLNLSRYREVFGSEALEDFPTLNQYIDLGLFEKTSDFLTPTTFGLEWSDAIGPSLFSANVRRLMEEYEAK